jgi:hypothetical protein
MPTRPFVLTLTTAAVVALTGAAVAQQASPAPSPAAEPAASIAPSDTMPTPSPEPSSTPADDASPEPSSKRSLSGTLVSIKGTVATIRLASGALQTYTVPANAAVALKKSLGKRLLFHVVRGALSVVPH